MLFAHSGEIEKMICCPPRIAAGYTLEDIRQIFPEKLDLEKTDFVKIHLYTEYRKHFINVQVVIVPLGMRNERGSFFPRK